MCATWGCCSALIQRARAGFSSSAVSPCRSHLLSSTSPEIKARHVPRCFPLKGWNYTREYIFFLGSAAKQRHRGFHSGISRLNHIQISAEDEALGQILSPGRLMGFCSATTSSGAKTPPSIAGCRGGDSTAAAPGPPGTSWPRCNKNSSDP